MLMEALSAQDICSTPRDGVQAGKVPRRGLGMAMCCELPLTTELARPLYVRTSVVVTRGGTDLAQPSYGGLGGQLRVGTSHRSFKAGPACSCAACLHKAAQHTAFEIAVPAFNNRTSCNWYAQ